MVPVAAVPFLRVAVVPDPVAGAPAAAPPPVARTLTESPVAIGVVGAASKLIVTEVPLTLVTVPVIRAPPPNPPTPAAPAKPPAVAAPAAPAARAAGSAAPVNAPPAAAPRIRDAKPASELLADELACLLPYQIPPESEAEIRTRTLSAAVYLLVQR